MISETQAKKLLEEKKIIKLISRLFAGERLNDDKYRSIADFVRKNGETRSTAAIRYVPVCDKSVARWIKDVSVGKYYMGIFVTDSGRMEWYGIRGEVWGSDYYILDK